MTRTLILLRHGQSEWNQLNLFTGWVDVRLTEQGKAEARRGGELLAESGLLPDVLHTSLLSRAIQTANIALDAAGSSLSCRGSADRGEMTPCVHPPSSAAVPTARPG